MPSLVQMQTLLSKAPPASRAWRRCPPDLPRCLNMATLQYLSPTYHQGNRLHHAGTLGNLESTTLETTPPFILHLKNMWTSYLSHLKHVLHGIFRWWNGCSSFQRGALVWSSTSQHPSGINAVFGKQKHSIEGPFFI